MRAVIDADGEVFTLINSFRVTPDNQDAVIASLRALTGTHARSLRGFVAASVHASAAERRVVNDVQWESKAGFEAMMATQVARAHVAETGALAEHIDPVVYRVAYVGSNWRAAR